MLSVELKNRTYSFASLPEVLGKANERTSGDEAIGRVAGDQRERVAARRVLAELTLGYLYENPAVPYEKDEVTRLIIDSVDNRVLAHVRGWSVGELREFLLSSTAEGIRPILPGLTSEMIAAVVKLCSNIDLVLLSQKLRNTSRAKTTIGLPGTLSSRLQPNHPTDSLSGILALAMEGLSYGSGDCLIGVNPAIDSIDNLRRIGDALAELIERHEIPTVSCVLSHLTTQMEAVRRGARLDILFQSIAGTEKANKNFGVTLALLREAAALAHDRHPEWQNVLYFETGQGSELSLESDEGVDQVTLEARTYGVARPFAPYMVNNVSGFIGPEILFDGKQMIRANLEDLCMAKLHNLPMGMAPCYTTHAEIDQNDHEMATMLLTIAGSNFFMGIAQNEDVMLSYQDTSFHDDVTLRRMFRLKTTPEFEKWMEKKGLLANGEPTERFGDPSVFQ